MEKAAPVARHGAVGATRVAVERCPGRNPAPQPLGGGGASIQTSLHVVHNLRIRRCATTPRSDAAILYASTPDIHEPCDGVGRVVRMQRGQHEWPVSDAWTAICAVSLSRISPIRTDVRVLPQDRTQRRGEGQSGFLLHLHLYDPLHPVLHRSSTVTMLTPSLLI